MNKTKISTLLLVLGLLSGLGCGPDAKRDNPLDPVNGRGVWGTVRNSKASPVPGAVVTAGPVNINTVCDAQGGYQLELPGGERYILAVRHPQYYDAADTIDVPSDGKLEYDFIITGKPSLSNPRVNTYVIAHENGQLDRGLVLECLGTHPEGQASLDAYLFYAMVEGKTYPADSSKPDVSVKKYAWDLNLELIYGTIYDPESLAAWIIGKTVTFSIEPGEGLAPRQATVPLFSPVPTSLVPNNGAALALPGNLSWTNAQASGVDITIEIWQGTQKYWSLTTANVSNVQCTATLAAGVYLWLVRATDGDGNSAAVEATFTIP